jgi:transcriptional regulator with XRE-family HTH domain
VVGIGQVIREVIVVRSVLSFMMRQCMSSTVDVNHIVDEMIWTCAAGGVQAGMPSVAHPKRPLHRHFLQEWREHRGLSQEQAALRLSISRTQLSKIENMRSPYSQGLLEAAAEAYGCAPADLIMRNPSVPDAPWSIYETLRRAPEAQQQQIRAVVETLLKTGT